MPVQGVIMKKSAAFSLTALTLLASAWSGHAAPYFPYETIEKYYEPPPEQPTAPPGQQPGERPVSAPPRTGQPVAITQAPVFLFPAKLGYGVAVGVPYDMMYISEVYYLWQAELWYRSSTYRGPWITVGYSQLPPELRNNKIAQIRQLRNSEFRTFWKDKAHYKGKQFRPGLDTNEKPAANKPPS
jgi:hypothetical protein